MQLSSLEIVLGRMSFNIIIIIIVVVVIIVVIFVTLFKVQVPARENLIRLT